MARLTKRTIDAAEARSAPYFVWDAETHGFGVRVFPSGRKVFYVDYRPKAGGRKRMKLGPHGILTCEDARKLAIATLGDVIKGADPLQEHRTRREAMTVEQLCDRYLEDWGKGLVYGKGGRPKKISNLHVDRGRIDRHIKPLLGKRLVADLRTSDVAKFQADVAAGKTRAVVKTERKRGKAIVEGGAGTAKRTLGLLGGILSHARDMGVIEINPAHGVRRMADGVRDRRLTPDEYRALGTALSAAEEEGESWQAIAGIRLLALTGCRLGEIQSLRWSEVDAAGSCLRLRDSKEGKSTRPIGQAVLNLLNKLPREDGQTFVLTAMRNATRYGSLPRAVERMTERAGLQGVTPHVLRHSYASTAGDMGMSIPTIGALLGHSSGGVTSRYIHQLDTIVIAAADKVAGEVSRHMSGTASQVILLSRAN